MIRTLITTWLIAGSWALFPLRAEANEVVASTRQQAEEWRVEHRTVDLHQHIDCTPEHLARTVKIMDAVGLGLGVNLSGGTVTRAQDGGPSEFERNKRLADALYPGRFVQYMNLDYSGWDQPGFAEQAARQIEEGHRLGAAGFKEYKRLGLYLRDGAGQLIRVDDPKLDPMWRRCGELHMPVSIHGADPRAFWLPYDDRNASIWLVKKSAKYLLTVWSSIVCCIEDAGSRPEETERIKDYGP